MIVLLHSVGRWHSWPLTNLDDPTKEGCFWQGSCIDGLWCLACWCKQQVNAWSSHGDSVCKPGYLHSCQNVNHTLMLQHSQGWVTHWVWLTIHTFKCWLMPNAVFVHLDVNSCQNCMDECCWRTLDWVLYVILSILQASHLTSEAPPPKLVTKIHTCIYLEALHSSDVHVQW